MDTRCGLQGAIRRRALAIREAYRAAVVTGAMCLLVAAAPTRAAAQQTTQPRHGVHGLIVDSAAAPVPGATVSVYGFAGSATSNDRGEFALAGLMRGTRVVEVVALGYKPRLTAVAVSDSTAELVIVLARARVFVLDSVQVRADRLTDMPIASRRTDRISEVELAQREIVGGSAFEAFALLRPQLFHGRPPPGISVTNDANQRAQLFPRDPIGSDSTARTVCVGNRACEIDGRLSVSINEGRPGSPDILTTLPVRIIREMRYLLAVDAAARFGMSAGGGPVLVVYTR